MPSLKDITSSVNTAANVLPGLSLLFVRPKTLAGYQPQPGPPFVTPPIIVFNYEGEQTVTLRSESTDHFSEANIAFQDTIAIQPELITTNGFIGELNDVVPPELAVVKQAAERLTPLAAYEPVLSQTALLAYQKAKYLYDTANNAKNSAIAAYNTLFGDGTQTKQQIYFQQFYLYWRNKVLFTVYTPWQKFDNCVIETLRAVQDEQTAMISNFEVTFKPLRFATTQSIDAKTVKLQLQRAYLQGLAMDDRGSSTLTESDVNAEEAFTTLGGQ